MAFFCFSAVQVGPAGGVRVEVVLAEARWVVGGGEHVGGGQRRREVVARLLVNMVKVVLVQRLQRRRGYTRKENKQVGSCVMKLTDF